MTREELITKRTLLYNEIGEIDRQIKKIDEDIVAGKINKVVQLLNELYHDHKIYTAMDYDHVSLDLDDMAKLIEEYFSE
jgi:hypothetical protein